MSLLSARHRFGIGLGEVLVTPLDWPARMTRWLVALVICITAYQLYAWTIVPIVEPNVSTRSTMVDGTPPRRRIRHADLNILFQPDDWERQNPKVLETERAVLLFQDYRPLDKGRLELKPCTVVVFSSNRSESEAGGRRPIVMRAPGGALLSFSGSLDPTHFSFRRLTAARLVGEIQISSPPTNMDAHDGIQITTRNVQILPQKIWSPHDVSFQYGKNWGSGRGLTIALQDADDGNSQAEKQLFSNVQELELEHVDKWVLSLPSSPLMGGNPIDESPTRENRQTGSQAEPRAIEVELTCLGPFQIDFQRGCARFEDHVDMVHSNPDGSRDQLQCEQLLLYLGNEKRPASSSTLDADSNSTGTTGEPTGHPLSRIAIQRIEAVGSPVRLQAPSLQTVARGQRLEYDFSRRIVRLEDDQGALFAYRRHEVVSPFLEYQVREEPRELGQLRAKGPGKYVGRLGDEDQRRVDARWQGDLLLEPQNKLHVLSLVDGADVDISDGGHFSAQQVYIWLEQRAAPANSDRPSQSSSLNVRPVKMLARGQVHAQTRQLTGSFQRLETWFDYPATQPEKPGSSESAAIRSNSTQPNGEQLPSGPALLVGRDGKFARDRDATESSPIEMTGEIMRLRLEMVQPEPRLQEATVTGNVHLRQIMSSTAGSNLIIDGGQLRLQSDALNRSTVDVVGPSARILANGLVMEGTDFHLSQKENRIWSQGPGRMKLPTRKPKTESQAPLSNTPMWVYWQGSMDFDGQLVRFLKQVEVRGVHNTKSGDRSHVHAVGDQLQAQLNQYVSFEQSKRSDDLDIVELRYLGTVITENQTFDSSDALVSHDHLQTRDLVLDRRSGDFHAKGPGWISSTRLKKPDKATSGSTRSPLAMGRVGLVYLRVDYENGVQGNIDLRELEFQHFVRTVYGPVETWNQVIASESTASFSPDDILMTCDRLIVADMGTKGRRAIELTALGHTVIENVGYSAKADRLSYAEAKRQLTLEALGRNFAQLQYRPATGGAPSSCAAKKILYWPDTGQLEVFGGKSAVLNQAATGTTPSARIR